MSNVYIPETLHWCREHYVPPVKEHIHCHKFGNTNGIDGSCRWCMEMEPYQWHMYQDASTMNILRNKNISIRDAIDLIEARKQVHPMPNERKLLLWDDR